MGIFSAKKKTYVTSVAYAMGDDSDERTDMLRYTVLNANLQGRSIADSIRETYLRGQGMSLRSAFVYARDHYFNKLSVSRARYTDQPDTTPLVPILVAQNPGSTIRFLTTLIGTADYEWWAEAFLARTYGYDRTSKLFISPPPGVESNANLAYDLQPNGQVHILLMNSNGAIKVIDYRPENYVRLGDYVHTAYQSVVTYDGGITTSTRDALPGEEDSTHFAETSVERAGEIQSTTTKTVVSISGSVATVTVSQTIEVVSRPKYFMYLLGSGTQPSLDAQYSTADLESPYFPAVPLRGNNTDLLTPARQSTPLYKTSKKLLAKVGLDIDDLREKVNSNSSIGDIDYAFAVFGVSLNATSPESKAYLFRYMDYLRSISSVTSMQFNDWVDHYNTKYGGGAPLVDVEAPPTNSVEIYCSTYRTDNYDVRLQWQYIDGALLSGEVSPGAKKGTVTVTMGASNQHSLSDDLIVDSSMLVLRRQVDENTYEQLTVSGLTFENFIYQGKSVIITAADAMSDPDEGGFIIPLNQEIVRTTPLIELTNLSYQCVHMVFNCYKVVKQKWYQTTLFKIIIVIIAIIIIVVTWGSSTPAVVQSLAVILAAGGAITLTIMILAATIYVLAMMVIANILMGAAVRAFGPTWGPIIVMVLAIMTSNYSQTGSVLGNASSYSNLISAQNIIQATSSLATAYVNRELTSVSKDAAKLESDYTTGMAKIEDLTKQFLGTNTDIIDITGFTQASYQINYELPSTFMTRTLLTGSDVCEITSGLVDNFADVGLQLPATG